MDWSQHAIPPMRLEPRFGDRIVPAFCERPESIPAMVSEAVARNPDGEALVCDDSSMAPGETFTVHVSATTTPDSCGLVENSATVTTGNDGEDTAGDNVTVLCPDVTVLKTADNSLQFSLRVHKSAKLRNGGRQTLAD